MKEHTLKELADIGAKASRSANGCKLYGSLTVDPNKSAYVSDAPFREAFAKAVRDAVLKHIAESGKMVAPDPYAELKAAHAAGKAIEVFIADDEYGPDRWSLKESNSWSLPPERYRIKPKPVLIPLDINDIRATDEFRPCYDVYQICTLLHAGEEYIRIGINHGFAQFNYAELAANYLRRQHGSNEWKLCTKESK
jgi:hypothetical protein